MARLQLEGLTKVLGGTRAVDGLELVVEPGELLVLLGPSGCGKTTTLNLIAGFETPDAGAILLNGSDIVNVPPERRNIGVVFQNYALFPHMTVVENVAFGLRMRGVPKQERAAVVAEMLDLVHLAGMEGRYPKQLSGGQQQRVALARALAIAPSVLLLDEPLSNLDAKLRKAVRDEIVEIQRRTNVTTILVTHDQEEALAVADRVAVMDRGRLLQVDASTAIYQQPANRFVAEFVGEANVLDGHVVDAAEGHVDVSALDGTVRARSLGPMSPGAPVVVIVRPEHVHVSREPSSLANSRLGAIRTATYQGTSWRYQVQVGETTVRAVSHQRPDFSMDPGTPVHAAWEIEDGLALADETDRGPDA